MTFLDIRPPVRYLLSSLAAYVILVWNFILNEEHGERYFLTLNACGIFLAGPLAWLVADESMNLHGSAVVIFVFIGATVGSTIALSDNGAMTSFTWFDSERGI